MRFPIKKLLAVILFATLSVSLVPAAAQVVINSLNTTEERGWNSVTEKLGDTATTEFHGKWVNYLSVDDTGWKAIDTRFYRTLDGFQMKDAPFEVYLPLTSAGIATFHNNNKWDVFKKTMIADAPLDMTIQALGVIDVPGRSEFGDLNVPEGLMKGVNYVIYPDAYPNGDLIYYVHFGRAPRLEKLIRFTSVPTATSADGKTTNYYFKLKYSGATDNPEFSIATATTTKKWDKEHDEVLEEGTVVSTQSDSVGSPTSSRSASVIPAEAGIQFNNTNNSEASSSPSDTATSTSQQSEVQLPTIGDETTASSTPQVSASSTSSSVIPAEAGIQNNEGSIIDNSSSFTPETTPPTDTIIEATSTPPEPPASTTPAFLEFSSVISANVPTLPPSVIPAEAGIQYDNIVFNEISRQLAVADGEVVETVDATTIAQDTVATSSVVIPAEAGIQSNNDSINNNSSSTEANLNSNNELDSSSGAGMTEGEADSAASSTLQDIASSTSPSVIPAEAGIQHSHNSDKKDDAIKDIKFKKAKLSLNDGKPISVLAPTPSNMRGMGMKQFQIWDSNFTKDAHGQTHRKKQNIAVELQPTENPGEYILTKIIPIEFFASSTMPVFTDTTTTFYPDPNVEVTSVDGDAGAALGPTMVDFATMRVQPGTDATDSGTTFLNRLTCLDDGEGGIGFDNMFVNILLFDTSSIPDNNTISSATFSVYGSSILIQFAGQSVVVTNSNPVSNTALAFADFTNHVANMGTEYGSSRLAASLFSTVAYNDFTVNATGLSNISKTTVSKFGMRLSSDFDNTDPGDPCSPVGFLTVDVNSYSADQTGTSNDPKLVVTYAAAGNPQMNWSFIYNYLGVAMAKSI